MKPIALLFSFLAFQSIWGQACNPPTAVTLEDATETSLNVSASYSQPSFAELLLNGNYVTTVGFQNGHATFMDLQPDTEYQVCAYSRCMEYYTSTRSCITVRTSGGTQPNVEAPSTPIFLGKSNVVLNEQGRIELFLPDPNSDGWDMQNRNDLAYRLQFYVGCDLVHQEDLVYSSYPQVVTIPTFPPTQPYQVYLSRFQVGNGVQKDGPASGSVIISSPTSASSATAISTNFQDVDRFLLHIPKLGGGFRGTLSFTNRFPDLPAVIWVCGFDVDGNYVEGTRKSVTVIGSLATINVYAEAGKSGLFGAGLVDQVAYLGLRENANRHLVNTSITYQNISSAQAFPATLNEVDFDAGLAVGSAFAIDGRKSANYWDGMAITNLSSDLAPDVYVVYRRTSDGQELARHQLGAIAPGEKLLAVASDFFTFQNDTYYTVETDDLTKTFQVLGLRGSNEQALLVGSEVSLKR
ncbi:MAG: hypothetical protein H6510_02360 [Acidobacteria bacterium]|nr:hypothetical protein [Acidobacteriota bacterium]MCB9396637.1 hypothetical protein [Acidobacteriota bacterium]